ncbi:MAG: hypothetical protein WD739_11455 [Actinomycetota bacterium]
MARQPRRRVEAPRAHPPRLRGDRREPGAPHADHDDAADVPYKRTRDTVVDGSDRRRETCKDRGLREHVVEKGRAAFGRRNRPRTRPKGA